MKLLPDNRVKHFWDGRSELVKGYAQTLSFKDDQPAWDVYFAYDREVEWKENPPLPTYWMTKLKIASDRKFDGEKFAAEVRKLIDAAKR